MEFWPGVTSEWTSWLALRAAASDLAFFCGRKKFRQGKRTGGDVAVGRGGGVRVRIGTERAMPGDPPERASAWDADDEEEPGIQELNAAR